MRNVLRSREGDNKLGKFLTGTTANDPTCCAQIVHKGSLALFPCHARCYCVAAEASPLSAMGVLWVALATLS